MRKLTTAFVTVVLCGLSVVASAGGTEKLTLRVTLTGKAEVPKGDPDGRGTVGLTLTSGKVCWVIRASNIGTPTAAHIHQAAVGKAGPIVVPFAQKYRARGCASAPVPTLSAILDNPSRYYVNIHNAKYPAGALRGQLTK